MNYILLFLLLLFITVTSILDFEGKEQKNKKQTKVLIAKKEQKPVKKAKISAKKKKFYSLLLPAIQETHSNLMNKYIQISSDINKSENIKKIQELKQIYKVQSDKELLLALKPHPQSIVIAQAAMESAWGTSRFFREANNIFGMWSANKNEARIAAGKQRDANRTIWLRKFDSIEDSVKAYYKLIATAKAYKDFRETRYKTNDPYEIVKKLDKYSELGEKYTQELTNVIRYNELTKYDR